MRFLALLRKELRESLPWLLLAGVVVLAVGLVVLRAESSYGSDNRWQYYDGMTPGEPVNPFRLFRPGRLELPGLWLAFTAPALGLILGVRHFWMPLFTRTWSFLLHRSATRATILGAKLAAALIALTASLGLVWTGLYWYACRPDIFPVPEAARTLVCGWIYIALGFVIYLGTALSALSTARWYTTRIFGLAFAGLAVLVILQQWHLVWVITLMILASAILLIQTVATFNDREF
jgi:hypothetical protein